MSRFVSTDAADFDSLQSHLLHRGADDDAGGAGSSGVHIVNNAQSARKGSSGGSSDSNPQAPLLPPHAANGYGTLQDARQMLRQRSVGLLQSEGAAPRKLGTWDGVFMPVSLNILGIILFLRFGFILGQAGLLGALFLLLLSYMIDVLTVLSLNAISTNGQVRGGGAYYLISRSLGPEFGGSIGLVFFLGQAFNTAMNALGFVETLTSALGEQRSAYGFLPESSSYLFLYGSLVLWASTLVCLFGSAIFARATLILAFILSIAIGSIPLSTMLVPPFEDAAHDIYYTSWSWRTLAENMWPHFTAGAAGSSTAPSKETWQSVFGVLFPAVCGILAGASMSGDLRKPSKSIPKGTNAALIFTFTIYACTFIIMACTISREALYRNIGIISDVSQWPAVIICGSLASCAFSVLMGVMACAKVLQAIARDDLLPMLGFFATGTGEGDVPVNAVLATAILCQLVLCVDQINTIAQLVTMTTLLTFGALSFATCALKAGGAPSFRPSFRYWNIWTAAAGALVSFAAMLFTDAYTACACGGVSILLFVAIQLFSPPKPWGDVSHNVTYHFVRKYLLRLDERKGHVKYWRPQILLLANNPRTEWNLIIFCNSLKKGALYILGHVLKGEFQECVPELRRQHLAWLKLVDVSGVKSFVDIVIAKDEREGARSLLATSGLGGMRPNIIVLGFPTALQKPSTEVRGPVGLNHPVRLDMQGLPTDSSRLETPIRAQNYVGILEDALSLNKAIAIAYGFDGMCLPGPSKLARYKRAEDVQYIDLWPVQIASAGQSASHVWDTYTMVLQLGTILSFTGTWSSHQLRVNVFVEHADEIGAESIRVRKLLENLRIPATLRVFCLSSGGVPRYDAIVLGKRTLDKEAQGLLQDDKWWATICAARIAEGRTASQRTVPIEQRRDRKNRHSRRLHGVQLPEEHINFHTNNIRLGLAHPRSRVVLDGDESEMNDSEFDEYEYDELENELASLAVDWDPAANSAKAPNNQAMLLAPAMLSSSQRTLTPAMLQGHEEAEDATATPNAHAAKSRAGSTLQVPPLSAARPPESDGESAPWPETVSFNGLPNKAQYLILNELIRRNSSQSTSVVITALPAPERGSSASPSASSEYLAQLQTLYGGGPPVLGVHATTITMTMSL
ncbi:hypothetical protein MCUN1_002317 [Malassezia cuniculi]|uniref:Solute carrier family 12 member 3 n=1 Tax=Malassezia cuniculi TaxID=948313 RepID=A0AAF0ERC7_9BASI|nr:hypothetical protein MCUN1_002317 [Malassezia cuniculi]